MESYIYTVSKLFSHGGAIHYALPHFQREYSWTREQWSEILRDLFFVYDEYEPDRPLVHFLGLMVMTPEKSLNGTISQFKVIDGQQRLITLSLIFIILRDIARQKKSTQELAKKIDTFVTNYLEKGLPRFKVFPSTRHGDNITYTAIVEGMPQKFQGSLIADAYTYLHRELRKRVTHKDASVEKLHEVLMNSFQVAVVILDKENENPYKIFESLDGKGKLLSQADLVRNYIAMTLPVDCQERVFEESWVKIETLLRERQKIGKSGQLTAFVRHYLAMRRQMIYAEEHVYERFRDYMEQGHASTPAFIQEISTLSRFAEYYATLLTPDQESDSSVRQALSRLAKLETSMTYPLLLAAFDARQSGQITSKDLTQLLTMLENLLIRRYLCGDGPSPLFKWFTTIWEQILRLRPTLSYTNACRQVIGGEYYPTDRRLRQSIHVFKAYSGKASQNRTKIAFILMAIEGHLWGSADVLPQLKGLTTIEHIMPQTLTETWKNELGLQWEQIHKDYLHTLGNLTLVTQGKNAQLSNSSFSEKKRLFQTQGLRLNAYMVETIPSWNDRAIITRADWLVNSILEIWPSLV